MKEELDQALVRDFPNLFADRYGNMRGTALCWGFECGDGWYSIIRELANKIEPLCVEIKKQMTPDQIEWYGGGPKASQVKEKYGTLRFYMTSSTEEIDKHIEDAESRSEVICEQCGEPGKLRGRGWLYTACNKHTKEDDQDVN